MAELGKRFCLWLLVLSMGAASLIEEVVWHRYLGILLGSQGSATALVLGVFLGGLGLGYALFGKLSQRSACGLWTTLARVEVGLAVWSLLFPFFFRTAFSQAPRLFLGIGEWPLVSELLLSLALLLVPSVLMGATLPLLTQALSKSSREASSRHAWIYGWNTLGAGVGCLLGGYLLLPTLPFAFALGVAAALHAAAAIVSYGFAVRAPKLAIEAEIPQPDPSAQHHSLNTPSGQVSWLVLSLAFCSGFTVFTLQTILVRVAGLSAGSSHYVFALVAALFIFALGLGSLASRRLLSEAVEWTHFGVGLLGAAWLWMLVYYTVPLLPYAAHVLRALIRDIPQGFYLYQLLLAGLFTVVLFPAVLLLGAWMPVLFHLVGATRERIGLRVGQIYALNAAGAVLGALGSGYVFLVWFDLDTIFRGVLVLLGLLASILLVRAPFGSGRGRGLRLLLGLSAGLVLGTTLLVPRWDRTVFIQPFRHPKPFAESFQGPKRFYEKLAEASELIFFRDDPTTSVQVSANKVHGIESSRSLFVNGKSDGDTRGDLFTTVLLGHLPGLLAPQSGRALVIGYGTGMTAAALALHEEVRSISIVELSQALVQHRTLFDAYNLKLSRNEKVRVLQQDAFRYLLAEPAGVDLIVSEPSNPWVVGVENLYTREFYELAHSRLSPDGTLVQWIHTYSFDDRLVQMVLRTLTDVFPEVRVFQLKGGDVAVLARKQTLGIPAIAEALRRLRAGPVVRDSLKAAGIESLEALLALEVVSPSLASELGKNGEVHSLEYPRLSDGAAKAFFSQSWADLNGMRRSSPRFNVFLSESLLALYQSGRALSVAQLFQLKQTLCENRTSRVEYLCREVLLGLHLAGVSQHGEEEFSSIAKAELEAFLGEPSGRFSRDHLQKSFLALELLRKHRSVLAAVSFQKVEKKLGRCFIEVSAQDALYGECLLQRTLGLEALDPQSVEFKSAARAFLEWYEVQPQSAEIRRKLAEAAGYLREMLVL